MDKTTQQTKEALQDFTLKLAPATILPAVVISINDSDLLTVRLSSGLEIDQVRLRSVIKEGSKFLLIPKLNSVIQIARIENSDEFFVAVVSELEKMLCMIGTTTFEIDENGILISRAGDDLLKVMSDLVDSILNEKHITSQGPTTGLLPDSIASFNTIKTRLNGLLKSI